MNDLDSIPHITTTLLYIFNGELFRIGAFIKEDLKYVKQFTGYGEMYGLYTHSHGGVVHVATFQKVSERKLSHAMSHRAKAMSHDYTLSLIGGWFTVQDTNLSVCELLRNKANTLKESETYFCIVVDKPRSKVNFQDISGLTKAFFLVKGNVYTIDMKILNRESPFRFDTEFTDMISSAGSTAGESVENEDLPELEYFGTEMKHFSSQKLERNIAPVNSENLFDHNGSELPELPSETREGDTPLKDEAAENSMVKKSQLVLPLKDSSLQSNTSEKDSESDREAWVNINQSDADCSHVSPTDETSCEATSLENEKRNKADPNSGSLDDVQKESMCNNSVPEKSCTLENKSKINEDQQGQEGGEDEDIGKEDNVMKNECLPDEDVSASTDQQDEENMIMEIKDEMTIEKQQAKDNDGSSEKISTREDTTENNIVPEAEQFQEIENDCDTKSGATVETEIIDENKGNLMTCEHNVSDDEKSQQKEKRENKNEENGENTNVKSDEVLTSENILSAKEFSENHERSGDVDVKTSSESTEGEKLPKDGDLEVALVTEDSSKDIQVGTEQNNFTSGVEGRKNSSLPNTD